MKFITIFIHLFLVSAMGQSEKVTTLNKSSLLLVNKLIPNANYDIRYFTKDNFVGEKVDGYLAPLCFLSPKAANALKDVSLELNQMGLELKIFDCYRPQKAVDHFVRWAKDLNDNKTKEKYYPRIIKNQLFKKGYISSKSGHSRGSSIDLTIIDAQSLKELDMGTGWDYLDPLSHTANQKMTLFQRVNRLALKAVMEKYGFKNYSKEWWHFTFKPEQYPETYFNFDVDK